MSRIVACQPGRPPGFVTVAALGTFLALIGGCGGLSGDGKGLPASPSAEPAVVCLGYVDVEGGLATLASECPGSVAAVLVQENQVVQAGEVLVKLDTTDARKQVESAQTAVAAARTRLALASQDVHQHPIRLRQLQAAYDVSLHQLAAARIQLRRQEALYQKDLVNHEEVEAAQEHVEELEAASAAARARRDERNATNPGLNGQAAQAEVQVAQSRLALAEHALARCEIRAPANGRILSVAVHPGEVVGPTSPLLTFCPDRPFIVRAEIEQELLDRVQAGMTAQVRNEGSAGPSWSGQVVSVGRLFQRRRHRTDPTQHSDVPTVECLIRLAPGHPPLGIGQRVVVSIPGAADQLSASPGNSNEPR